MICLKMIDIGYLLMAENTQCFSNWLFVKETDYRDITSVVDKAKQKQEYPFWTHFTSSIPEFSSFTDLQLNPPAFRQSRLGRKNTCCFFLFFWNHRLWDYVWAEWQRCTKAWRIHYMFSVLINSCILLSFYLVILSMENIRNIKNEKQTWKGKKHTVRSTALH